METELLEAHQRWITFAQGINTYTSTGDKSDIYDKVLQALDDDFNTPIAISLLYQLMKQLQVSKSLEQANDVFRILNLLSITSDKKELKDYALKEQAPQEVLNLMEQRWQLKSQKEWAKSDELRKEILEKGWDIKDSSTGYIYSKVIHLHTEEAPNP